MRYCDKGTVKGICRQMDIRVFAGVFAVLLFTVAVAGCSWRMTRPDIQALPAAMTEQLTQLLREREFAVQTVKGLFQAKIQGPGIPIAQRVEGALFYRRPDALRLQGFNRLGGSLFEFILGADLYTLRLPAGQVLTGRADELDRIGKVAQPFRLSLLAMSGIVGIPAVAKHEYAEAVLDGDRYRLDVFAAPFVRPGTGPFRLIWFDRGSLQVVQEDRLSPAGELEATVRFDDYRPVGVVGEVAAFSAETTMANGALIKPFRITAHDEIGHGTISLTFHEIVPNTALKAGELTDAGLSGAAGSRS